MRDFTAEEKELIASTPITVECFDMEKALLDCMEKNRQRAEKQGRDKK